MMGSPGDLLKQSYPELNGQDAFLGQIVRELHIRGLLGIDQLNTMMSGAGMIAKRTTELGDRFLSFITAPASTN